MLDADIDFAFKLNRNADTDYNKPNFISIQKKHNKGIEELKTTFYY